MQKKINFWSRKQEGAFVIMTLIIGLLMLALAIGAAKMVVLDLLLGEDFLHSERAYFSAESGMELALGRLKVEPVEYAEETLPVGDVSIGQSVDLLIPNKVVEPFMINLEENEGRTFRLKVDDNPHIDHNNLDQVSDFNIKNLSTASIVFDWKVRCYQAVGSGINAADETISLQKQNESLATNGNINFSALRGSAEYYNYYGVASIHSNELVFYFIPRAKVKSCFFTIKNPPPPLGTPPASISFEIKPLPSDIMSPPEMTIKSTGKAADRTKILTFKYLQKNLGELFDFGIFHLNSAP